VGSVAIRVSRRTEFDGVVKGSAACLVAFREESGTDQFPVTVTGRESHAAFANPFPAFRNGAQVGVAEAAALRPDSSVEHSDDNVGSVVSFGPQATLVSEANKLRGASGVKVAAAVLEDGEDGGVLAERSDLLVGENCGEAVENGVVEMEDAGWVCELGGVPVVVCGEN